MIKVTFSDSYKYNDPTVSLVDMHSRGVDKQWIEKNAAHSLLPAFDTIKPESNKTLIRLIAMGAADTYGSNRNGDAFYKSAAKLDLVDPDWSKLKTRSGDIHTKSAETFSDATTRGLIECHDTFVKHGHVFRNHKNKPQHGDPIHGQIKASAYNDKMNRVDLLISVDNDEWRDDLQKIASDENVPFSMACIISPEALIMTETGYREIKDIKVGDKVYTHKGNWKPVTKLNRRKYTGKAVNVSIVGHPLKLQLTADHPLLSNIPVNTQPNGVAIFGTHNEGWNHVKHFEKDTVVYGLFPSNFEKQPAITNVNIAAALADIVSGTDTDLVTRSVLAQFFNTLECSDIPLALFNSTHESIMAFVGSLIDSEYGGVTDKAVTWMHIYDETVLTLKDLLLAIGINATVKPIPVFVDDMPGVGLQLSIALEDATHLLPFSVLLQHSQIVELVDDDTPLPDINYNRLAPHAVSDVEVFDVTDTEVYNLEVADDESYILYGIVSHNCKVPHDICTHCGHKAKTTKQYCEHLTTGLSDLLKTGHVVAAANEDPCFFDISRVHRPADRIAWSLTKSAAAGSISGADIAQDMGFTDNDVLSDDPILSTMLLKRAELIRKLAEIEKKMPAKVKSITTNTSDKIVDSLKTDHVKLSKFIASTFDYNCVMPLNTFAQMLHGDSQKTAELVEAALPFLPSLFSDIAKNTETMNKVACDLQYAQPESSRYCDRSIVKLAASCYSEWSVDVEPVVRRTQKMVLNATQTKVACVRASDNCEVYNLLDSYAGYQLAFVEYKQRTNNNPEFEKLSEFLIVQNRI